MSQRPIVQLIDLLGKKWVLRIIWELHQAPATFRELQSRCGDLSPTMINNRIKELTTMALVTRSMERGYELSELGNELLSLFMPINQFAEKWAQQVRNRQS